MTNNEQVEEEILKNRPILKQFSELKQLDFTKHPVWVHCHIIDYNKPWYNDTNEETFRPWSGKFPVKPSYTTFLVRSAFTLNDGTVYQGFVTPVEEFKDDIQMHLGTIQPHILHPSMGVVPFWYGFRKPRSEEIKNCYKLLQKTAGEVFPMHFKIGPNLSTGISGGKLFGFYHLEKNGVIKLVQ